MNLSATTYDPATQHSYVLGTSVDRQRLVAPVFGTRQGSSLPTGQQVVALKADVVTMPQGIARGARPRKVPW